MRIFCFGHAGGGPYVFSGWPSQLSEGLEIYSAQLPGRQRRLAEPSYTRLAPLIEPVSRAIVPFLDRPFALFGHSMGAIVAFEACRWLGANGYPAPVCLFVSAALPPNVLAERAQIHGLPEQAFIEELRKMDGLPDGVLNDPALLNLVLKPLRADFESLETYRYVPGEPIHCPIYACVGEADAHATAVDAEGWSNYTDRGFQRNAFAGGHFFIYDNAVTVLSFVESVLMTHCGSPLPD